MALLWLELKKLGKHGLRVAAVLLLTLAVLNGGLGAALVLAAPGDASFEAGITSSEATKLVHLQLFGGLVHLHEGATAAHSHKPQPNGVFQVVLEPETRPSERFYSRYTSLDSSDSGPEMFRLFTPTCDQAQALPALKPPTLLARQLSDNTPHPLDPYLTAPDKPPTISSTGY